MTVLRSGLFRAVQQAGEAGLRHDELPLRVFDALQLPLELYASNPNVQYAQRDETERALREVLGYYLYQDLRRGWRLTSPNLEQSGLLEIDYLSLQEFCADNDVWSPFRPALVDAPPEVRETACRVLLDFMRRELAIRVSYLDSTEQDRMRQLSTQYLVAPWAIHEQDALEASNFVLPRGRARDGQDRGFVYVSSRGGFGMWLRQNLKAYAPDGRLTLEDSDYLIKDLLRALIIPGIVHAAPEPKEEVPGYQVNASAMIWQPAPGRRHSTTRFACPTGRRVGSARTRSSWTTTKRAQATSKIFEHENTRLRSRMTFESNVRNNSERLS